MQTALLARSSLCAQTRALPQVVARTLHGSVRPYSLLTALKQTTIRHHRLACRGRHIVCSAEPSTAAPAVAPAGEELDISAIDLRIGKIVHVEKHPEADSLYVEQIDVGEEEPRTIVSGLVKYVPAEQLQDKLVVIVANLKPRNMRGIKSNGMLLCASDAAHENVEPLEPPSGAAPGERVFFGEGGESQPEAEAPNKVQKKKMWETLQPLLKTDDAKVANFKGRTMLTSAGPITAPTLSDANIA